MDNDAMDGAERVNTYGIGELDMFEFFVADRRPLHRWRTEWSTHRSATTPSAPCLGATTPFGLFGIYMTLEERGK